MLNIYNSLTREKQHFVPIAPGKVRMYVCGMTVYDYCHLGHARVLVVFDMVTRWLKASGYEVTYVRNITDIDDKIIKRCAENKETLQTLTNRYIQAMDEDSAALGIVRPDFEPRATQHIADVINIISRLIEKNLAYRGDNGDVFYSVHDFKAYGKLSGKSLADLRAGERVDIDAYKRDPLDFVLWKATKPGEPAWDSPWGPGRPGWHIECSAMSEHYLGNHFDIHGGGADLQFPHHENEIAQSEGAHDCTFVNYWMHNGFVRVDDVKMSKSLGNFFTIRDVLQHYDAEVLRFFILRAHYRSPLNHSDQHLNDARQALTRLYTALRGITIPTVTIDWEQDLPARFRAALDDDFNTPEAFAVLFELAGSINRTKSAQSAGLLKTLGQLLGLLQRSPEQFLQGQKQQDDDYTPEIIEQLIQNRLDARKQKDYAEADRIRQQLADNGIILEDSAQGTTWRRT